MVFNNLDDFDDDLVMFGADDCLASSEASWHRSLVKDLSYKNFGLVKKDG